MTADAVHTMPAQVQYWASHTPDRVALHTTECSFTYAELNSAVDNAARRLLAHGVAPGDRVVIAGYNTWQWVVAFLGTLRLGALAAPANTRLSAAQFAEQCDFLDAALVLTDDDLSEMTAQTRRPQVSLTTVFFTGSSAAAGPLPVPAPHPHSDAILSFTSGTTGVPKGAVLTHQAYHRGSAVFAEVLGTTSDDSTLVLVPLFHNTGFVDQLGQMLVVGGRTDLLRKFKVDLAADALAARPVTYLTAVPSILRLLMTDPRADRIYSQARHVLYGGSPMPAAWTLELSRRFPDARLYHGYGLTEFTSACTILDPAHAATHPESVGVAVPDVALRVVGDDGADAAAGHTGEIWVSGPTRMRLYWGRPDATEQKTTGPWLRTGDLGYLRDGLLYLAGRVDDVINRGGEKVLPSFVESVLCEGPGVAEACVFGVPDPVLQRRVHAAIRARTDTPYDPDATKAVLKQRLPDYAVPEVIHIVTDFPRGASGKVDRAAVAAQFQPCTPLTPIATTRRKYRMTPSSRRWDVVVIGAGGSQAQAMLAACARGTDVSRWLAVDRAWRTETHTATEQLGITTLEQDALSSDETLRELLGSTRLVANLAGPYYRTGTTVLDAAIATGTDYLDICDDADVTVPMLQRAEAATAGGVRALIGMGSSPGTSNVLIRAALDHLRSAEDVEISWTVDINDMTDAAVRHFWHCFNLVDPDGTEHPAPSWEQLERRTVTFPGTVGTHELIRLAHPEPLTVPRFLPVTRCTNYGALTPLEALVVAWSLAFAVDAKRPRADLTELTDQAVNVFRTYRQTRPATPRIGSGMQIDVHTGGNGLRFAAGTDTEMAEATGVPAAAGVLLLLSGKTPEAGVFSPETLLPADFFTELRKVSRGGGGLSLHRLVDGQPAERVRIRDLLTATPVRA
jgi:acyl-CoA synthetase (AMP-forming)/AMP-acid ligase II